MIAQNRFKSWTMWAGVAGALWLILSVFGIPQKLGITDSTFKTVLDAIGTILSLLGVVNNPTSKNTI